MEASSLWRPLAFLPPFALSNNSTPNTKHPMTDHNNLRTHYRRSSHRLAREKRIHSAFRWLALWLLIAIVGISLALA